jgi:Flp pilus assembly protein TadD
MRRILAILFFAAGLYGQVSGQVPSGDELFEKGQYAAAAAAYEKVPASEMTGITFNRLAISYHMLNKLKEAETAYKESIKRDPKSSDPFNNLGALYYTRKNFGEAERQFRLSLEADAENVSARKNLRATRYARENGRPSQIAALAAQKDRPLLIDQRDGEALTVFNLMPEKDIADASQHEKHADAFMARKMYEDAIIEYRKAFAIDKYNPSTANRLGLAYHQSQKFNEAELSYREAIKLNPYYIEALNNLGTIEYLRKRYDRALDEYSKALKLRPKSSTILHNVGACLFAMERYEEGISAYRMALSIDPQLFDHMTGFGTIIQTAAANESMQDFYMAKVFADAGDKERAISFLYKAYEGGFKDIAKIKAEPSFGSLLEDERFLKLLQTMTQPGSGTK